MGAVFALDMTTLVVGRIISILILAVGVTILTLRRDRYESVLFCCSLLMAIFSWITIIAAVATKNHLVTAVYVGCVSTTVSLQWAAMVVLSGRKVHRAWFVVPPLVAMLSVLIFRLDGNGAGLVSAAVLSVQLAAASVFIVYHGAPVVRMGTSILMSIGYAVSFCSAFSRLAGVYLWPEVLANPLAPVPAVTLPFLASYVGTMLITLSWVAALKDRAEAALADLAFLDELTGLSNRRRLRNEGRVLWERSRKQGTAFSMLTLDIDHFKQINDRFGHDEGDRVLATLGEVILRIRPAADVSARMGGEEFCLVFVGLDARSAHEFAEKLREEFARHLRLSDGTPVRFSAGVAQSGPADDSIDAVYRRADNALYQAKASGRDCTVISALAA